MSDLIEDGLECPNETIYGMTQAGADSPKTVPVMVAAVEWLSQNITPEMVGAALQAQERELKRVLTDCPTKEVDGETVIDGDTIVPAMLSAALTAAKEK